MFRRDYLIRKIEEFGKALSMLRSLLGEGDRDRFEKEIESVSRQFTGMELQSLESLDPEGFSQELARADHLEYEEKKMIAHLFFEKLHYYLQKDDLTSGALLYPKCILIYRQLQEESSEKYDLEVHYRVELLEDMEDQFR
jgi:hypothetical protein